MNKYGKNLLCYFQLQHFIVFFVSSSGFLLARKSWIDLASILQRQNLLSSPRRCRHQRQLSVIALPSASLTLSRLSTPVFHGIMRDLRRDLSGSAMNGNVG